MSVFDKLMFWKKSEPDFGASLPELDQTAALNFGPMDPNVGMPAQQDPFAQPQMPTFPSAQGHNPAAAAMASQNAFGQMPTDQTANVTPSVYTSPQFSQATQQNQVSQSIHPRDVELILARLDTIRAEIENISHRMTLLERDPPKKGW